MLKIIHNKYFYVGFFFLLILVLTFFVLPNFLPVIFVSGPRIDLASVASTSSTTIPEIPFAIKKVITHIKTPEAVKGIYMTACVAGTPSFRAKLVKLINETELNSVIIDIKDYTGTISFKIDSSEFKDNTGGGCKVSDMVDFIETLHQNNIYVIGRITAFQDPYLARVYPDWAVKKNTDKSINWKDRKGISYIDAGNKEMWLYLVNLGKESYANGFDEINFDYIRFPSDGDMSDIYFPWSNNILVANATSTVSGKSKVMKSFFEYLHENFEPAGIPISADFFGMTATNYDDLNIGQVLEDAIPNFDYIAPMVYPSHYPVGFLGYKSVAEVNAHPYEIVNYSMNIAANRLMVASSTPLKLRPWLQDNDYPVPYTPAMVRAQIQATYDSGLTSWMLWDAGNTYTQSALKLE
ncbi:MAG: hypothetical protein A2541_00390 [Candidatus Taylorbacteria bacterium RIFOXYD2_FULL_36_9]|uniref:DUF4015 domain-containing protein n=1 Tax=Candidatus Taylorbacteria bacterium RIFOXYD2_FULL_36_9 TaxID=1802338 RepID=A0A1G2PCH5_9BACT|nr:MAG: hypothetical protein A2541_00390 [Candidatus Taylorbacteria bacterium RIFOXYD2_FULL_36_9]